MADSLPSTMRAIQFSTAAGGLEKNLYLNETASLPKKADSLPEGSTLVKISYASPNPVDYKLPELTLFRMLKMTMPGIPCGDFAGTVVKSTLPNLKPGDRVCGRCDPPAFGALAEYAVVLSKDGVVAIPDGLSLNDAATIGVAAITAYQCLAPYAKPGSRVFINGGSGGTGTYGIQIAKALGYHVTTTCSTANIQLCKDLGADEVVDYRTTNIVEYLKSQKEPYDLIVDNVNSPDIYFNAHHYLKQGCPYNLIAGSPTLSSAFGMLKMFYWPSWLDGGKRELKWVARKSNADEYTKIAGWMAEGKVKAVIEETYELEKAGEMFAMLKSGRVKGKLVIEVGGE
jgi:NADPH:quinone reductase-like Zn-dependent oxidoreductase